MGTKKQNRIHVPPEGTTLTLVILALSVMGWMIWILRKNHDPVPLSLWLCVLFCSGAFLVYSKEYTITERHLVVRFWGIPYRWICWEKVSGCACVSGMKTGGRYNPTMPTCIIITLHPRLPFAETTFPELTWFMMRNQFFAYQLYVPKGKMEEYLKALEERVSCPVITIGV